MVSETEATGVVADIYAEIRVILGSETFVPNFFKAQAHFPDRLQLTWNLVRSVLCEGQLDRLLKEMMFVRVAAARQCVYCQAAHLAFCAKLGVKARSCDELIRQAGRLFQEKYVTMLDYVSVLVEPKLDPAHVARVMLKLRDVSAEELAETSQMCALAAYASILADALQVEVDQEFHDILGVS